MLGSDFLKIFVEGMNGKMRTHFIGKDKVVAVLPELTAFELVLRLPTLFIPKIFKAERGRLDRARACRSWWCRQCSKRRSFSSHAVAAD